MLFLSSS